MTISHDDQLRQYLAGALRGQGNVDLSWVRARPPWQPYQPWIPRPAVTAEQVARQLYADTQFRALELGTWLNTPDGKAISAVVGSLLPYPYRQEAAIVVEALRLAAKWQRNRCDIGNIRGA